VAPSDSAADPMSASCSAAGDAERLHAVARGVVTRTIANWTDAVNGKVRAGRHVCKNQGSKTDLDSGDTFS
jgi:hypothetical protein